MKNLFIFGFAWDSFKLNILVIKNLDISYTSYTKSMTLKRQNGYFFPSPRQYVV